MACYGSPGSQDQVLGDTVDKLVAKSPDKVCTPAALVDASRSEDAPTHDRFEWDDGIAGELHRMEQARLHLRTLRIIDRRTGERKAAPAFVHVVVSETRGYQPLRIALAKPRTRDQVFGEAVALWQGTMTRVTALEAMLPEPLAELQPIRAAVETASRELEERLAAREQEGAAA